MKLSIRFIVLLSISTLLSACVFVPSIDNSNEADLVCHVYLPRWELDLELVNTVDICRNQDSVDCLMMAGVVLPTGSFVLSGSVVLVGNTLRWVEYHGRCDDGYLKQFYVALKERV